jgi:hypothetical protein
VFKTRLKPILLAAVAVLFGPFISSGCVTVHEAEAAVKITEFGKDVPFKDCYLMSITRRSAESEGHWWVVEREERPPGLTSSVTVKMINSGDRIYQDGYPLYLIGPYAKGKSISYEYWIFKEGFLPERVDDIDIELSAKKDIPVAVSMELAHHGENYSDKHVMNGAWAIVNNASFLSMDDKLTQEMARMSLRQVRQVQRNSFKPRSKEDAGRLIERFEKLLAGSKVSTEPVPVPGS